MRDSHRIRDGFDLHLDNRQISAFVIGSLVVLGVVFSMGVMVGKQLASGAAQASAGPGDPLAAIDAKEKVRTGEVPPPGADKPEEKADLTFQKELTKPGANPLIEPTRPATGDKKEPEKKDEKPAAADKKDEKPAAEKKEEKKDEPEEKKDEKKLAAAFEKVAKGDGSGAGAYTLQVASFPTQEEADKLVTKLAAKGVQAYVFEADVAGKGRMYRVRTGAYATRSDAEEGLKKFKKKSALPAIIASK